MDFSCDLLLKYYGLRKEELRKLELKEFNNLINHISKIEAFMNGNFEAFEDKTINDFKSDLKKLGITAPKGL